MATLVPTPNRLRATAERRFFTGMAVFVLLVTFVGFAPSYYLRGVVPMAFPVEPLTAIVHLHAVVFSAWIILFMAQTGLVAAGRVDIHRRMGIVGVVLVASMIPLGLLVGVMGVHRPLTAPPGIDPLSWSAVPLLDVPVFGGLIVAALLYRHVPAIHKRLMLCAMVNMFNPSLGRALTYAGVPGPAISLVILACLLPLVIWDIRSRGRLHPATIWGSAAVAARLIVTPLIWTTAWWTSFARWASSFVA